MTDEQAIREALASHLRTHLRLRLGPNALAQANAGLPVMLNAGEAGVVVDAALEAIAAAGLAGVGVDPAGRADGSADGGKM